MLFNTKQKNKTKNYEGATAFVMTPQLELYTAVVTTSMSDKFYETGKDRLQRIIALIKQNDPVFVAKLAVYAREKMYLRSVPLVLAIELAKEHRGDSLVSKLVERVVQRADEITEILAYYELANDRKSLKKLNKLSKQVQKGLASAFNKFDEYQFSKYNRDASVKLRDALFLVHPKAKDESQQAIFDKIAGDTLNTAYTWETQLSAAGQHAFETEDARQDAFRETWESLIDSGKMGYMALMRNLRNMLEKGVSHDHLVKVCQQLANKQAVLRSKQLPFRFLSAYRELKAVKNGYTGKVLEALEAAVIASAANIRGFDESTRVVVACDVSASMQRAVSPKSSVQHFDIGLVLGMILQSRCANVEVGMFGNTWKTIAVPRSNVLASVMEFHKREGEVGYSTNGYLVISDLIARKKVVDKVFLFTDGQLWDSTGAGNSLNTEWAKYKQMAPNARIYLFDLAGYGSSPLRVMGRDVFLVAGWSDKIFDILQAIEEGSNAVAEIEAVTI